MQLDKIGPKSIIGPQGGEALGRLLVVHFLAIGPAAALALARVLAFASVVARLATAFTLARVLPFACVPVLFVLSFFRLLALTLVLTLILLAERGFQGRKQNLSPGCCASSRE